MVMALIMPFVLLILLFDYLFSSFTVSVEIHLFPSDAGWVMLLFSLVPVKPGSILTKHLPA